MSLDRLMRAADALEGSPEGDYLATAVRRMLAGLGADQALELCGPGAQRERDRLIGEAAALLEGSAWRRARLLSGILARMDQGRTTGDGTLLEALSAAERAARVPRSDRQLFAIITEIEAREVSAASAA
jgi:hypothetical protein